MSTNIVPNQTIWTPASFHRGNERYVGLRQNGIHEPSLWLDSVFLASSLSLFCLRAQVAEWQTRLPIWAFLTWLTAWTPFEQKTTQIETFVCPFWSSNDARFALLKVVPLQWSDVLNFSAFRLNSLVACRMSFHEAFKKPRYEKNSIHSSNKRKKIHTQRSFWDFSLRDWVVATFFFFPFEQTPRLKLRLDTFFSALCFTVE